MDINTIPGSSRAVQFVNATTYILVDQGFHYRQANNLALAIWNIHNWTTTGDYQLAEIINKANWMIENHAGD